MHLMDEDTQRPPGTRRSPPPGPAAAIPRGSVRVATLMAVPGLLRELGADPAGVFAELGLDPEHFEEPEHRIPLETMGALAGRCAARTGCPHFGLLVGRRTGISALGPIGFLLRSAPDPRTALGILACHFHLHNDAATIEVSEDKGFASLGYAILEPEIPHQEQILDGATALAFNLMRTLCGEDWLPVQVRFAHSRPRDVSPFRQLFQAPLLFDFEETGLVFAASWLDRSLPSADPLLHRMMRERVDELEASADDNLVRRLRRVLPLLVRKNRASLRVAASCAGLPIRTLNRRLAELETSFSALRDEARHAVACQLLAGTHLSAAEITERLGYAAPSAFTRAFNRWAGMSPARWRALRRQPSTDGELSPDLPAPTDD